MPRLGTVPNENTASTLSGGPQPGVEGAAIVSAASSPALHLRCVQVQVSTALRRPYCWAAPFRSGCSLVR